MSSAEVAARRLLLVHAHPDDESIGTGATMAKYAAEGAQVTLVTCTLGELGEIIPPSLAHLGAGQEDKLGEYRIGELAAACDLLGVTDHRFLGGPGRWRDSGMMGTPANADPRCFWQADVDVAAAALLDVIREVRPQVLVTYDANGYYGHPDHIQAHRVAWRAFELASPDGPAGLASPDGPDGLASPRDPDGPDGLAKFYATAAPDSGQVSTEIDATGYFGAKLAALRAHATQVTVADPFFALSDNVRRRALGIEYYTLLAGPPGPSPAPAGRESDLFNQ